MAKIGFFFFFFFQAEDGIRDLYVTGVQTCALPIWRYPAEVRGQDLDPGRPERLHGAGQPVRRQIAGRIQVDPDDRSSHLIDPGVWLVDVSRVRRIGYLVTKSSRSGAAWIHGSNRLPVPLAWAAVDRSQASSGQGGSTSSDPLIRQCTSMEVRF